jgi:hypothetical protein
MSRWQPRASVSGPIPNAVGSVTGLHPVLPELPDDCTAGEIFRKRLWVTPSTPADGLDGLPEITMAVHGASDHGVVRVEVEVAHARRSSYLT